MLMVNGFGLSLMFDQSMNRRALCGASHNVTSTLPLGATMTTTARCKAIRQYVAALLIISTCTLTQTHAASRGLRLPSIKRKFHASPSYDGPREKLPSFTHSGYVPVNASNGSDMFYIYYEAQEAGKDLTKVPIVLWLQLYINGPYFINPDDFTLRPNPGSWNRMYGLLYIEQPIGTGFSHAGKQAIPSNEVQVAADLYAAMNAWYEKFPHYKERPLLVTGESYAGKYVPSFAHYILQATARWEGWEDKLPHARNIGPDVVRPKFKLGGLAIGNGWTDANTQQLVQGQVAWAMGLIDATQKLQIEVLNTQVIEQLNSKNYRQARELSDRVNGLIGNWSGTYTLEDVRRNLGYDGYEWVDQYLNQADVKSHIGADPDIHWDSCSDQVDHIMGHDVMKSVRNLVVDLLDHHPVLLYHGQWDAECGVASNDAWVSTMKWSGHADFNHAPRTHWYVNGRIMGFWRQHAHLSLLVVRNTGHMVPHDNPYYGQILLERWVEEQVLGRQYNRQYSESEEQRYLQIRGPDEGPTAGPP